MWFLCKKSSDLQYRHQIVEIRIVQELPIQLLLRLILYSITIPNSGPAPLGRREKYPKMVCIQNSHNLFRVGFIFLGVLFFCCVAWTCWVAFGANILNTPPAVLLERNRSFEHRTHGTQKNTPAIEARPERRLQPEFRFLLTKPSKMLAS